LIVKFLFGFEPLALRLAGVGRTGKQVNVKDWELA